MTPKDQALSVRGVNAHLLSAGKGEPVLYLHGIADTRGWLPFHELLSEHCQLLAPDLLGFGRSDRPEWLDTIQDFAVYYLDLLDELGLERVHLIGSSLGGWIAAELASWSSHRLRSLVLIDPAGVYEPQFDSPDVFTLSHDDAVRLLIEDQGLAARILGAPLTPEAHAQRLKGDVTFARVAWNPYLYSPKLMQRLHRISAPALLLWGAKDRLLPVGLAHRWQADMPRAELQILPGCGHLVALERPNECAEIIGKWLDRHR